MAASELELIIFEGPQGVGKTTSTQYLTDRGFILERGIPTGQELMSNGSLQNWRSSIDLLNQPTGPSTRVLDRCLWSIVAFNQRLKPNQSELIYRLGREAFKRALGNRNYALVFIDSTAEECYLRKSADSGVMRFTSFDQYVEEITIYRNLYQRLADDGFPVTQLINTQDINFLYQSINLIMKPK